MHMHVSTCAQVLGLLNRWDWPSWMVGWTGVGVESLFVTALLWRIIKTAVVPISTVFHLQPIFNKLYMYLSVFAVIFIVLTEMTFEYQSDFASRSPRPHVRSVIKHVLFGQAPFVCLNGTC